MSSPDEGLRPYATDLQWKYYVAACEHGSANRAAEALGVHKSVPSRAIRAMKAKAARHGYAPDHDMTFQVPDGFHVRGVSTLYDKTSGEARLQWVKSSIDRERQEELFREMVDALAADLPRVKSAAGPRAVADDLCVGIPVGDLHVGLLAWHEENAGENYSLDEAEQLFMGAIDRLVASTPAASVGLLALLGDFLHYDSHKPVTPQHGHQLDADSRPSRMVRVAIKLARYAIEALRKKHAKVRVIVEIGNHDLYGSIFLMEALAAMYEHEPRVEVDTSPRHYHYFRFGKVLIGTHHGDRAKLAELPGIMATDRPAEWGETRFRYWWTGHVHHSQKLAGKDLVGAAVESFRVMAATDAHADREGYRSMRDIQAIVYHRDFGETGRVVVNPEMLL